MRALLDRANEPNNLLQCDLVALLILDNLLKKNPQILHIDSTRLSQSNSQFSIVNRSLPLVLHSLTKRRTEIYL